MGLTSISLFEARLVPCDSLQGLEAVPVIPVSVPVVVRRGAVNGGKLGEAVGVRGTGVSGSAPEEQDEADEGHDEGEPQELLEEGLLLSHNPGERVDGDGSHLNRGLRHEDRGGADVRG